MPTGSIKGVQAGPKFSCRDAATLVELGIVGIHSCHHKHARAALLLRQVPCLAGADFDARGGVNRDNGKLDDRKRTVHLSDEVGRSRGVNDIDVSTFPRGVKHGGMNRFLPFFLVCIEVTRSRSVAYPAQTVDLPTLQKHRFTQHGFSIARVPHKSDVADSLRVILSHCSPLPCSEMTVLQQRRNNPSPLRLLHVANAPGRTRTCDLRIRNPPLYPAELRGQALCLLAFRDLNPFPVEQGRLFYHRMA